MHTETRKDWLIAFALFVIVLAAYMETMALTTPFWDGGEFIATSYILGIPHPPGTPLYVLLGRIFTLPPVASVAARVNFMSALSGALAVLFTFLVTVKLTKMSFKFQEWKAWLAGIVASLFMAFSNTFWQNATEAEVYALSSFVMVLTFWMALRWAEAFQKEHSNKLLLLIVYVLSLCVGIHLGTLLVAPGILLLVLFVDWRIAVRPRLLFLSVILFALGVSVHLYLLIRANLDPAINEASPKTWHDLWLVLKRDQYKPGSIFVRRAEFSFQLEMFWRYFIGQFTMWGGKFEVLGKYIPVLLGLVGAYFHALYNRRTFAVLLVMFLVCSLGLIIYLNFTDHEVRERDYFYVAAFHFFAIWIGIGAAGTLHKVVKATKHYVKDERLVLAGVATLFVLASVMPYSYFHFYHDKTEDRIARNFGYNMLTPLEKDAILITNGDNDTFPLWYIQAVEGVRNDVRVANMSLLRTSWYIKQLKNTQPAVPFTFSDSQIDRLVPYRDQNGKVWQVNQSAVYDMIKANNWERPLYLAVTVPDQMGLTGRFVLEGLVFRISPEDVGLRLDEETMRRNMFEIYDLSGVLTPDGKTDNTFYKDINSVRLIQNYAATHYTFSFWYRQNGKLDEAVELMERAHAISPQFVEATRWLGQLYIENDQLEKAEDYYANIVQVEPGDAEVRYRLGRVHMELGRPDEAIRDLQRAIELDRSYRDAYIALADVYTRLGMAPERDAVLRSWLQVEPGDAGVRAFLEKYGGSQ
jgi:Tfp pilus assembly protein PilF